MTTYTEKQKRARQWNNIERCYGTLLTAIRQLGLENSQAASNVAMTRQQFRDIRRKEVEQQK